MTNAVGREELLTGGGSASATIEEYVAAAKQLTRLRAYVKRIEAVNEELDDPQFMGAWDFWTGHPLFDKLRHVDDDAGHLAALVHRVYVALEDPLWSSIEQTVREAAVRMGRAGGVAAMVPDAEGTWIEKGHGHLVQGTRAELAAAEQRWTLLDEVLPPKFPNDASRQMGPGVA